MIKKNTAKIFLDYLDSIAVGDYVFIQTIDSDVMVAKAVNILPRHLIVEFLGVQYGFLKSSGLVSGSTKDKKLILPLHLDKHKDKHISIQKMLKLYRLTKNVKKLTPLQCPSCGKTFLKCKTTRTFCSYNCQLYFNTLIKDKNI